MMGRWSLSISIQSISIRAITVRAVANKACSTWFVPTSANTRVKPMKPSVKKWIKGTRGLQLALRCFELIASAGLLVFMILITHVDFSTVWIMRIVVSDC